MDGFFKRYLLIAAILLCSCAAGHSLAERSSGRKTPSIPDLQKKAAAGDPEAQTLRHTYSGRILRRTNFE